MRVAHINSMSTPCPPHEYGGTERCLAQMITFLAAICGHDVTLYASSDSGIVQYTAAIAQKLGLKSEIDSNADSVFIEISDGSTGSVALRTTGHPAPGYQHPSCDELNQELIELLLADERRQPFDLIHNHHRRFTISGLIPSGLASKTLTHSHSPTLEGDYGRHCYPLLCISHSQAARLHKNHGANVFEVIYHGLDRLTYTGTPTSAGYLVWLGHFAWKKAPDVAIQIARKAGRPLILAGMLRENDEATAKYYREEIEPAIDLYDASFTDRVKGMTPTQIDSEISFIAEKTGAAFPVIAVGSVSDHQKQVLFGNAMATLFPVRWTEPFGLVMIESMACGTPVIGYTEVGTQHCGAVEEVIEDGVTGFHIQARDEDEALVLAAQTVMKIPSIRRSEVRRVFEREWSSEQVARRLDASYKRFLANPNRYMATPPSKKSWGKHILKRVKKIKKKIRKIFTKKLPRVLRLSSAQKTLEKKPVEKLTAWKSARMLCSIPLVNDCLMAAAKIYIDAYNDFSYDPALNGEKEIIRTISKVFKGKTTVFDVGANIGDWTAEIMAEFNNVEIHLFELSPMTFETLLQRYSNQQNIHLNNLGLSNEIGEVEFKDYGKDFGINTLLLNMEYHKKKYTLSKAQITRGDEYCLENKLERIRYLKIDTEGSEFSVLQGFESMIANNAVDIVQFEYGYANGDAKALMKEFYAFFVKYGYIVGPLRNKGVRFKNFDYSDNDFKSGPNYIACLPEYRDSLKQF